MAIGNNIRRLREAKDWTQADLATRMGTTNVTISRWESGSRVFSSATLRKLATVLRVTPQEVLGTGEAVEPRGPGRPKRPVVEAEPDVEPAPPELGYQAQIDSERLVPVHILRDAGENETLLFDNLILKKYSEAPYDDLRVIEVCDGTMSPLCHPGDLILIDTTVATVEGDGVFAVRFGDRKTPAIRRVSMNPTTGKVTLSTDNSAYPDFDDVNPGDLTIHGRAIWKSTRL